MNQPIFFSIVVPTYNRAAIISPTIESILAQTYPHFEIIIVDDGSTDDTEEVIQKYLSDRVHYYRKPNAERAAARNFGTMNAQGDYVNWFDSDDIMFPGHLAEAAAMIGKYDGPEIFAQSYEHQTPAGQILEVYRYSGIVNQDLWKGNMLGNSPVIVRRDIALANPFNEDRGLSGSEDYELWLRIAAQYHIYASSAITLAVIFHTGNSTLTMSDPAQLITRYTAFLRFISANDSVIKLLKGNKGAFFMKNYLMLAVDLANNGELKPAQQYFNKAVASSPRIFLERGFYAFLKHYARHALS